MSADLLTIPEDGYLSVRFDEGPPFTIDLWAASLRVRLAWEQFPEAEQSPDRIAMMHAGFDALGVPPRSGLALACLIEAVQKRAEDVRKKAEALGLLPTPDSAASTDSASGGSPEISAPAA